MTIAVDLGRKATKQTNKQTTKPPLARKGLLLRHLSDKQYQCITSERIANELVFSEEDNQI